MHKTVGGFRIIRGEKKKKKDGCLKVMRAFGQLGRCLARRLSPCTRGAFLVRANGAAQPDKIHPTVIRGMRCDAEVERADDKRGSPLTWLGTAVGPGDPRLRASLPFPGKAL